ncbi:MAG: 5-formyltetrahydrofolate cyclo-ligase [Bacteroidetes bacterium 47-18]|nr:MAG: 5-formyltetrahydrofolate cyclo-ligase [Bacteroidetes bacterium 47-18]
MASTDKATLRTLFKHKRSMLSTEAQQELDNRLLQQFRSLPLPGNVQYIMGFMPMQKFREPNVLLLIQDIRKRCPELQLAFPRVRKDSIEMDALLVTADTSYILSSWGIQEPEADPVLEPSAIDMIFIPLLAFDDKGYRVGYGKGVYDTFLQRCRPDVFKIGISYFGPVPEISDTYPGDIPLDVCITPDKIHTFNPSTAS